MITPKIYWERWVDPYGENSEEFAWPIDEEEDFLSQNDPKDWDDEEDDLRFSLEPQMVTNSKPLKVVSTPLGIIPILEHSVPSRVFKFWIGHCNFPITTPIHMLIDNNVAGVETFDVFTKYRFRIGVGKAFRHAEVRKQVEEKIFAYLNQIEQQKTVQPLRIVMPNVQQIKNIAN
jgi:hypothetical protein